jgi:hypothetical protein
LKNSAAAPADCSSGCTSYASPSYLNYYLTGIAVDCANVLWVSGNVSFSSLGYNGIAATKIAPGAAADCSSGCTAYINSQFLNTANVAPGGIAIDAGGNVRLENYTNGSLVELPAIAASTVTPLLAQPR